MEKMRYTLEGLDCAGCAAKAEIAINKAPWINSAAVDFMNKRLTVEFKESTPDAVGSLQKIIDGEMEGVRVTEYAENSLHSPDAGEHEHHHHEHCDCGCEHEHEHHHEHGGEEEGISAAMIATTVLAIVAIAAGAALSAAGYETAADAAFVAAIALGGYDVIIKGVKSIFKLRFGELALMTIAIVASALLGEFFEGAMVAVLFRIGEWLEDAAVDNSRKSIEKLAEIRPDSANVKRGEDISTVRAEEVEVGETIFIYPHERVPLDCVVTEGSSSVDGSALTGESVPVSAGIGTELLSGMINGDNRLIATVSNNSEDSAAARIIALVTESAENKGKAEKFVTRFSAVYTPIVVVMAVLIAVVPPLFDLGTFRDFIQRSLTFLVASCPCSIVISVPLAFFSSIGGASKFGVLVKGGNFAEILAKARAIAFDKTGTVTTGKPDVVDVKVEDGFTAEQVISLAAAAEMESSHPYAAAIRNYADGLEQTECENYSEISGQGVSCVDSEGRQVLCGGRKLLGRYNISVPDGASAQVYLAVGGRLAGSFFIRDVPADGAAESVRALHSLGLDSVTMLTGDSRGTAEQIAADVGIKSFKAELLPEDKVKAVEELKREYGVTAFVGDGINDAPVLAAADVGIAMGLGSGAAIEAADIVLSTNNLSALPRSIRHFRRTMRLIKANIAFSLIVKAIVLFFAALGYAPMWAAVFADVGVCIICIANSSRLIRAKA